jgi:hypothetical protein
MKRHQLHILGSILLAGSLLFGATSCSLDVTNPNSASEEQVLTTREGVIALAIGMQQYYATTALQAVILTPGVTSREIAINTTFANLVELEDGLTALTGANGSILAVWARLYRVVGMATDLAESAPEVPLAAGTRSGILALANLYKAMALGFVAQSFEQAPINIQEDGKSPFVPRSEVLAEAIRLLDDALQLINTTPPSDEFKSDILGSGFDLLNTIQAYRARYNLLAGRYQEAISAADAVDLSATSVFSYDDLNRNPIYQSVQVSKFYAPRDNFGTPLTEPGDGRLSFYLIPSDAKSDPGGFDIDGLAGFFTTASDPIPAYLPGEMLLIKAEANLALGNTDAAVVAINAVRTKTPVEDPFGIGASLSEYSGPTTTEALTEEIFRQRSAELFMTGMRWEDSRRLGQPGPSSDPFQRNRNFYPYPDQERLNNPNTPADPAS